MPLGLCMQLFLTPLGTLVLPCLFHRLTFQETSSTFRVQVGHSFEMLLVSYFKYCALFYLCLPFLCSLTWFWTLEVQESPFTIAALVTSLTTAAEEGMLRLPQTHVPHVVTITVFSIKEIGMYVQHSLWSWGLKPGSCALAIWDSCQPFCFLDRVLLLPLPQPTRVSKLQSSWLGISGLCHSAQFVSS
jgi:hypothetical protein